MKNMEFEKVENAESAEERRASEPALRRLSIDWTESEWFAVWLRLARGQHESVPVNANSAS